VEKAHQGAQKIRCSTPGSASQAQHQSLYTQAQELSANQPIW
jgi:hypothetical protein